VGEHTDPTDGWATEGVAVAYTLVHLEVADFDEWKKLFDADPGGRRQIAKGHILSRSVDNPNEVFVRSEFASVEDAKKFRQQLLDSGALNDLTVKTEPTVVEVVEQETY
jgi:hypothetical protein